MLHSFHCYYWRLKVLEGIPGLISHPRVRQGVCVQSWYAAVVVFFSFFPVKSNQPPCVWKSKWEPVLSATASIALIFHKEQHSSLKPQRRPCDGAPLSVRSFNFPCCAKMEKKKKNCQTKERLVLMCSLSEVVVVVKLRSDDEKTNHEDKSSPALAFFPSLILSSVLQRRLCIHRLPIYPSQLFCVLCFCVLSPAVQECRAAAGATGPLLCFFFFPLLPGMFCTLSEEIGLITYSTPSLSFFFLPQTKITPTAIVVQSSAQQCTIFS